MKQASRRCRSWPDGETSSASKPLDLGLWARYRFWPTTRKEGIRMKVKQLLVVAMLTVAFALSTSPASAGPPVGKCPPAFQGPVSFAEIIETWPPPPDFPDPEGFLAFVDINDDGRLCVKPLPQDSVTFIDNLVRVS